jgi:hypothetical protein
VQHLHDAAELFRYQALATRELPAQANQPRTEFFPRPGQKVAQRFLERGLKVSGVDLWMTFARVFRRGTTIEKLDEWQARIELKGGTGHRVLAVERA